MPKIVHRVNNVLVDAQLNIHYLEKITEASVFFQDLIELQPSPDNHLYSQVTDLVNKWKSFNKMCLQHRRSPKKLKCIDIGDIAKENVGISRGIFIPRGYQS